MCVSRLPRQVLLLISFNVVTSFVQCKTLKGPVLYKEGKGRSQMPRGDFRPLLFKHGVQSR